MSLIDLKILKDSIATESYEGLLYIPKIADNKILENKQLSSSVIARILMILGQFHVSKGDYKSALDILIKANDYGEKQPNFDQFEILPIIVMTALILNKKDTVTKYFQRAIDKNKNFSQNLEYCYKKAKELKIKISSSEARIQKLELEIKNKQQRP